MIKLSEKIHRKIEKYVENKLKDLDYYILEVWEKNMDDKSFCFKFNDDHISVEKYFKKECFKLLIDGSNKNKTYRVLGFAPNCKRGIISFDLKDF